MAFPRLAGGAGHFVPAMYEKMQRRLGEEVGGAEEVVYVRAGTG
jgi:hypothetical protein